MLTTERAVHSDPEIMSGMPVFIGTRVPVKTLFDYLLCGDPLAEFLDNFPTVTKEQAIAALRRSNELLVEDASPA